MIKNFLSLEGHKNPFSGSKVTSILLKMWILPIGGASVGEGLPCSPRSRLVFFTLELIIKYFFFFLWFQLSFSFHL